MLRLSLSLIVASVMAACTVLGPDYEEPEITWLEDWQPSAYSNISDQPVQMQMDLGFWWLQFNDPVLNQLITVARSENLQLRIAGLRIFESQSLLGIADSTLYPQVQLAGGAINYVNNQFHGGDAPGSNQSFASYGAGLTIGWEMDFWGRFQRGVESANAAYFSSIVNQQDMQVLISAQVVDLYFAYRTTDARIDIAQNNAAIQKRSYEITQVLFKNGEQSELDLQQAKTQYLATLSSIPELEISLLKIRNSLAVLLARPPGDIPELVAENYTLPDVDAESVKSIPANLLNRRPDVRVAAWQIAAQSAQIGIAETDYYPAISLLGSLGWSGSSLSGSSDAVSLLAGPSVSWNIFDYGRIESNIRVQDARLQQRIEAYQNTVLQAAREVGDAAFSIQKTAEQKELVDQSVGASQRALEIANTRYREGYAGFQRVLDAQRAMFAQSERQLLTHANNIAAVISLYKGLGGGWVDTPVEELIPESIRKTMEDRIDWGEQLTNPIPVTKINPEPVQERSRNE